MNRPILHPLTRRSFLTGSLGAAAIMKLSTAKAPAAEPTGSPHKICAFIKFLQSLSYDELADTIAGLGFHGIEATVRRNGYIPPEKVEAELPRLAETLADRSLEITVMTTDVNSVEQPHTERVLKTAAALGVKRYRMRGYRYDLKKPVLDQIDELRPVVKDLVALNRELGLSALYQNHSGSHQVGAVLWDVQRLMQPYPPSDFGAAFDIRHATVEGGLAWPVHFNLMRPHLGMVYVKDFRWDKRRPENVPLGTGQVDPAFFRVMNETGYTGPISLHVEYLRTEGTAANIDALKTDLKTLRELLAT